MASHPQNSNPNKPAFVLGNGISRLVVDIAELQPHGTIFACNAVYREAEVDHLVAVDVKMINEIIAAGYHNTNNVWTNPNKGVLETSNINFFDPHKGWSSGPTALWLAASMGHKDIYILGFDFEGLQGKFNNVYADTFNYKKSYEPPTFFGNWVSQTEKVIRDFQDVKFYRLVGKKFMTPPALSSGINNYRNISYNELTERFAINLKKA